MKISYWFLVMIGGVALSQTACTSGQNGYPVAPSSQASVPSAAVPVCTPTLITPYLRVNDVMWIPALSVTVRSGDVVDLDPLPYDGGSWNWMGPKWFTSSLREIDQVPLSIGKNNFVVTCTNPGGCQSSVTFTVNVTP